MSNSPVDWDCFSDSGVRAASDSICGVVTLFEAAIAPTQRLAPVTLVNSHTNNYGFRPLAHGNSSYVTQMTTVLLSPNPTSPATSVEIPPHGGIPVDTL